MHIHVCVAAQQEYSNTSNSTYNFAVATPLNIMVELLDVSLKVFTSDMVRVT